MSEYVTLNELSTELGLDKSNLRKYVLSAGFTFVKIRTQESKRQLTLALTLEDAEAVRELRQVQGFSAIPHPVENGKGCFYVVQLIPELDPNRIKLGFATNANTRLSAHRTAAPTATLVRTWPCRLSWEPVAIASVTREDCQLVGNEVFTCDNLDALIGRCETFFAIMPILP